MYETVLVPSGRDALVHQALTNGFKAHLPLEPRDRIYPHQIDKTKRLFPATEQTMAPCYSTFSPAFFDLITFDEAHRSLFRRFTEVMEYFDARMIGLTATPATLSIVTLSGSLASAPMLRPSSTITPKQYLEVL